VFVGHKNTVQVQDNVCHKTYSHENGMFQAICYDCSGLEAH